MAQTRRARLDLFLVVGFALASSLAWTATPKERSGSLDDKAFYRPELTISSSHVPLRDVLAQVPNRADWEAFLAGRREDPSRPRTPVFIDPRSGAVTNLLDSVPLIPGSGAGNHLTAAGPVDATQVGKAVRQFVEARKRLLGIDTAQLGPERVTRVNPDLWQVSIPQVYRGVPVRDARLAATISRGNLVLLGTETWGNVTLDARPRLSAGAALAAGFAYADGRSSDDVLIRDPRLEIIPFAPPQHQHLEGFAGPVGQGYGHRLVWTFVFKRPPDQSSWEVMVDARDGEVVAFQDINQYEERQIKGGVYPLTSTEICPNPAQCGAMQDGWPMPFADTALPAPNNYTDSAGYFTYPGGTVTTSLTGKYVDVFDSCGSISESAFGSLDLGGANGQHDCASAGSSPGNTASSRSAFYEVNKLAEQARGFLPANTWLQSRLTTNVNISDICNAYWNGSINFFRSGGGCRNTGEIAGVFDHEWGHGLDANDAGGALSNSSEAYADIAAIYRLQTSCVGHGFFWTNDRGCGQTADGTGFNANEAQTGASHCDLDCSGVRDADWDKHADHQPDTALGFVCGSCNTGPGPCGRQVHCAAAPSRQAAWDLVARDLQAAPFNYDSQTAFLVGNKLFYQGSGNIGAWHACTCGSSSSGCGATNAYMQWLAADDDNGNLGDGTPHMTALYNAFNRHGIACGSPVPQNSGCAGGPGSAPTLGATAGNRQVALSWDPMPGATRYWVLRTEGHAGCDFGKALIAEVTGASYADTQVANFRPYSYNVVAAGTSSACFSPVSNCETVTPTAPVVPDFSLSCSPSILTVQQSGSGNTTCTVTSENEFNAAVAFACADLPAGATCSFDPESVTPPLGGSASSTLTIAVAASTATGTYAVQAQGASGSLSHAFPLTLQVTGTGGGGAQAAVFDPALQAPKCANVGSSCDSGPSLLLGRDGVGPEPNQPNTIADSCADGTGGTFHADESNDRIKVSTLDGSDLAPGRTVKIDATVWAWTSTGSDQLDLYHAADATNPSWTLIATRSATVIGEQILSATYTLPPGSLQAVRARFRWGGSATPCGAGTYNDHDDLIFAVGSGETPGNAVYDPVLQAPKCASVGPSCDSGPSLLLGRDGVGPEPNQPNTIADSCADGTGGTFHADESNDRIKVSTLDGSDLAPGKTARIDATVWAWSSTGSDQLDLYYAADATNPSWTFIATRSATATGQQVLSATYTLPGGHLQAVRARFRWGGSATPCGAGTYNDHDDLIVAVANGAPVADPGGPYTGVRNQPITFDGSGSSDPDGDTLTYEWDFGDGNTGTGANPTHGYATVGNFAVTLVVNDGTDDSPAATAIVTIQNQLPVANPGGPYTGVRNQPIAFDGSGSSDPDSDPLTYQWDFGDGSTGTGIDPTHAYAGLGSFTTTLIVNDGMTNSPAATTTVTIANQPPVANPGGPYTSVRNQAIAFTGSGSSDPDGDPLSYQWSFGDGSTGIGVNPTHAYPILGSFTVTLVVNDGTDDSPAATTTVTIENLPPSVGLTSPGNEAVFTAPADILLAAAASDPDGSIAKVEFFAGATKIGEDSTSPYEIVWTGVLPGVYALAAVATDETGARTTSAPVSILVNAPPSVALTRPSSGDVFTAPATITLTADASDPDGTVAFVEFLQGAVSLGTDATSPYSLDWTGVPVGNYLLTARAIDDRGATTLSAPVPVIVQARLAPTADAYVRDGSNANNNFGSATSLVVKKASSTGNNRWTYVKFDTSAAATVTSARLRLFGNLSSTTSTTVKTSVFPSANTSWSESSITWNNKPSSGTTALATVTMVNNSTTARWYEWDVTAYLQQEKAAGRNVVTLVLKNDANSSPYDTFRSRQASSNRPELLITP
jgi:PKD repeat protein